MLDLRLLGRNRLQPLSSNGPEMRRWVLSWIAEVTNAQWTCPADVLNQFPSTSQENDIFLFPVIGCTASVAVLFTFPQQIALIAGLRAA